MRLIAPVAKRESLQATHLEILLRANFHTTLDARYALSNGIVYAAFLHPLSTLTRIQLGKPFTIDELKKTVHKMDLIARQRRRMHVGERERAEREAARP